MDDQVRQAEQIADAISDYFRQEGWRYSYDSSRHIFDFGMQLDGVIKRITFYVDVRETCYLVYAVSPLGGDPANPEGMKQIADFICRANYGILNGNFELDMNDGEIRYKCLVDCWPGVPPVDVISRSIGLPLYMFEHYNEGIAGVVLGTLSPKQAIALCEAEQTEESGNHLKA